MDYTQILIQIVQILCAIAIFGVLTLACNLLVKKVKSSDWFKNSKFLNPTEYFPQEEVLNLKQLHYLIMIILFIVIILYLVFEWNEGLFYVAILDIIVSLYLVRKIDRNSLKDKIICFSMIPVSALAYLIFGEYIFVLFLILHVIGYLYFIKYYYRKFVMYTENNGLGITIILLFSIVLISFLFTMIVEDVSPLDSIAMVSNAFTSNSFDPAGNSVVGKIDSLVLAWGGFILSGAGTATLAVSIIRRYVDRQFDEMEELIKNKKK